MTRILLLGIWMLSVSVLYAPKGGLLTHAAKQLIEDYNFATPVFGVRVSISGNSELTTYVCYLYNGRTLTKPRVLDRDSFIKFVSGHWPSIYNPDRINFFELHEIEAGITIDSITRKESTFCPSMDSLWKIRFTTYPFQNGSGRGWSNKYMRPCPKQELYLLNTYGIEQIDQQYFLDSNFWNLLHDVRDTNWINYYSSLK